MSDEAEEILSEEEMEKRVASLVKWNPREEKSKYVMALDDVEGFEEERKYLLDEVRSVCELILKDNSKEYLGQL